MSDPPRPYRALAAACLAAGALGEAWSFAASQPPGAALHLSGWPLAIERFALRALLLGALTWLLAPRDDRPSRALSITLSLGAALWLGGLAASALLDLRGTQLGDPRSASGVIAAARVAGGLALLASLALRLRR